MNGIKQMIKHAAAGQSFIIRTIAKLFMVPSSKTKMGQSLQKVKTWLKSKWYNIVK